MEKNTSGFMLICFTILLLCTCSQKGQAQTQIPMAKEDSRLMIWSFGLSTTGGELYGSEKRNAMSTDIRYLKFMLHNFALGVNLSMDRVAEEEDKFTALSMGAEAAYFYNSEGNVKPFIALSLNWVNYFSGEYNQGGIRGTPKVGLTLNRKCAVLLFEVGCDFELIKGSGSYNIYNSVGIGYSF